MRLRLALRVVYDAPALDCRRVLRILPHSSLCVEHETLQICPPPRVQREHLDRFGNRVLRLHHARIDREFKLSLEVESPTSTEPEPLESAALGEWKLPSHAAKFSPELINIARDFRSLAPPERAEQLNRFVFESLQYSSQPTENPPEAARIWEKKRGSCADFSHVLLALSRASGLPARYVAGFGPLPGALHAWVELGFNGAWHVFDPTHGTRAGEEFLPVAKGRDFYDCAPHAGTFRGKNAHLELHCE